ncbi:MAG: threonine/serine exporter family protein [Deltaproteobacteria bacterium]|nr:threonine/serine exporter family protein [Deltaproteobacteria bacterium]
MSSQRIEALVGLARSLAPGTSPRALAASLDAIEAAPLRHSLRSIVPAIALACGSFAVLNGGGPFEVAASALGGGAGQALRAQLHRRRVNQYAVTALCAFTAAGVYSLLFAAARHAGWSVERPTVGFISSVLFLVPGFPLVTSLLDVMQHQTTAAVSRLAYATMLLLAAVLGVAGVIAWVGTSVDAPPALALGPIALFAVRAAASFVGACGFAILFQGSWRNVLHVGLLAIVGNETRLVLRDAGLALALATFAGAFALGVAASLTLRSSGEPRVILTIPGVLMMVPGLYAFRTIVLFDRGEILAALQAGISVIFVLAAMAMGLAAARFATQPRWLRE